MCLYSMIGKYIYDEYVHTYGDSMVGMALVAIVCSASLGTQQALKDWPQPVSSSRARVSSSPYHATSSASLWLTCYDMAIVACMCAIFEGCRKRRGHNFRLGRR